MSRKSEVVVVDVLQKNEASRSGMIEIMIEMQGYLGSSYPEDHHLLSAGDQLTTERQIGAKLHRKDGDTVHERLGIFEPVTSDWHCMVCLLSVSIMHVHNTHNLITILSLCRLLGKLCLERHQRLEILEPLVTLRVY